MSYSFLQLNKIGTIFNSRSQQFQVSSLLTSSANKKLFTHTHHLQKLNLDDAGKNL